MSNNTRQEILYDIPLLDVLAICEKSLLNKLPNSCTDGAWLKLTSGEFMAAKPRAGQSASCPSFEKVYLRVCVVVHEKDNLVPVNPETTISNSGSGTRELDV